jgi:anaerobic ribonucleoside-triphosphate reductase activating protein
MKYEFGSEYIKDDNVGYWNCDALRQIIVSKCDILVDGRYEENNRDITLRWRGSSNQRVIDVQQSIKDNKVVLYTQ